MQINNFRTRFSLHKLSGGRKPGAGNPVPVPWRHGTLSEHEQASYRTYGDLIYTVLKLVTRSTILDGSRHRFYGLKHCL